MTVFVKRVFYDLLRILGIYHYARMKHRGQAIVLTYHGVLTQDSDSYVNRNCVSAAMFEMQMRWMKQHYTLMPLSELVSRLQNQQPLPEFPAAVTFDDGFRNNYSVAFPILVRYNVPAAVFLTTDFIGKPDAILWTEHVDALIFGANVRRLQVQMNGSLVEFDITHQSGRILASDRIRGFLKSLNPGERQRHILALERQVDRKIDYLNDEQKRERYQFLNWDEVRNMASCGIEFGSHTCSHQILAHLSPKALQEELVESRKTIERELQRPCDLFSYPNGSHKDFTVRDQRAVRQAGYRAAFSQIYGFNPAEANLYALRRVNIVRAENFSLFLAKISGIWGELKRVANTPLLRVF